MFKRCGSNFLTLARNLDSPCDHGRAPPPPPPLKLSKRCFPGPIVVNNSLFVPPHTSSNSVGEDRCPTMRQSWGGWKAAAPQTPAFEPESVLESGPTSPGKERQIPALDSPGAPHPPLCLSGDRAVGGVLGRTNRDA